MKQLRPVFLEKVELLQQGFSVLNAFWGIPSIRISPNDNFREKLLRNKMLFFDPTDTTIVKKNCYQNVKKKFNYLDPSVNILNNFINFQLFRFFWKIEKFFLSFFERLSEITLCFFFVGKRIVSRKKEPTYNETLNFVDKNPFSCY